MVFGFPVRFDTFALLLAAYAVFALQGSGIFLVALFASSILVHELGHAFAFRRYGCDSAIVIHAFGGMTMSYQAGKLTNREHIVVSLAGPLTQLLLLGIPSLIVLAMLELDGVLRFVVFASVFLNLGWALVNLLPMYPLDGGQVLYRALLAKRVSSAWSATKVVSVAVAAPLALAAWAFGFRIGVLLIAFTVLRGISGLEPGGSSSPIRAKAEAARAGARPVSTRGDAGDRAAREAYGHLVAGSPQRFQSLVTALAGDSSRSAEVDELRRWQTLLAAGELSEPPPQLLLARVASYDPTTSNATTSNAGDLAAQLVSNLDHGRFLAAVAVLSRRNQWAEILRSVDDVATLERFEDRLVDAGLTIEQMLVAREIRLRSEASDQTPASD